VTPFLFAVGEAAALTVLRTRKAYTLMVCLVVFGLLAQAATIKRLTVGSALHGECFADFCIMPQLARVANAEKRPSESPPSPQVVCNRLMPGRMALKRPDGYLNIYSERYKEFWERVDSPEFRRDPDLSRSFHGWGGRVYLFELTSGLSPRSEIRAADNV